MTVPGPLSSPHIAQRRVTAHEFVLDTLRRAILGGVLAGGSRLVQADIASQLSVSTTPVREALRDLAAEGLVVVRPHIGAVVRELDIAELVELYDIRKALEPLAIRRAAAGITTEEISNAYALAEEMEQEADPAKWAELNRRFHAAVEGAAHAPLIQSALKSIQDICAIYVAHSLALQPGRIDSGNREHRSLLEALQWHDGDAAASVIVAHLDATLHVILKAQYANRQPSTQGGKARKALADAYRPAAPERQSNPDPAGHSK